MHGRCRVWLLDCRDFEVELKLMDVCHIGLDLRLRLAVIRFATGLASRFLACTRTRRFALCCCRLFQYSALKGVRETASFFIRDLYAERNLRFIRGAFRSRFLSSKKQRSEATISGAGDEEQDSP